MLELVVKQLLWCAAWILHIMMSCYILYVQKKYNVRAQTIY